MITIKLSLNEVKIKDTQGNELVLSTRDFLTIVPLVEDYEENTKRLIRPVVENFLSRQ